MKKKLNQHHRNTKDHKKLYEKLYTNKMDNLEEMDRLLEMNNVPKLKQEETENLNSNEIESYKTNSQNEKNVNKNTCICLSEILYT